MKSKRTTLTALALSALMAVSTITSVTWAADLFSDGSEGNEVVAEDAEAFASSEEDIVTVTEEVDPSDEESLNAVALKDAPQSVLDSFYEPVEKDTSGEWYTYTSYDAGLYSKTKGQGVYWNVEKQTYEFQYYEGTLKTVPAKETGFKEDATCLNPPRVQVSVSFTYGDETYSGNLWYYAVDDFVATDIANTYKYTLNEHHAGVDKYLTIPGELFNKPDCEAAQPFAIYRECKYCHALQNWNITTDWSLEAYNNAGTLSIEDFLKAKDSTTQKYNYLIDKYKDYVRTGNFSIEGHIPDITVMTTLPPLTVDGIDYGEYDKGFPYRSGYVYNYLSDKGFQSSDFATNEITLPDNSIITAQAHYDEKANCVVSGGKHSGAMDPTRDAYVYNVTFCKVCGEVVSIDKDIFYHTDNMTVGSEFYMGVKNIAFFVNKKGVPVIGRIAKDDFAFAVLDNCDLDGAYNLCVTSKDYTGNDSLAFSVADTIPVKAGHQWRVPEVKAVGSAVGKEKEYFVTDKNGNIVATKNSETGEYEVHARWCNTEAYYTWEQHCWNPNCRYNDQNLDYKTKYGVNLTPKPGKEFGLSNPDLGGGQRKALPGEHDWLTENDVRLDGRPGRFVDPTKTEYKQIQDEDGNVDMEHHLEKYKDSVECRRCHTQTTLDSNKPDAVVDHIFVSKPDPDVAREEPTCGTTGSFERVDTCVCQLKDESTREKVTIPATDKHDFGKNEAQIVWSGGENDDGNGAVYIADQFVPGVSLHADIVRECTVCGELDSNGINTMLPGNSKPMGDIEITMKDYAQEHFDHVTWTPAGKWCAVLRVDNIDPAKTDPATGIAFRCSTAHATISVDWVGTVDGKVVELNKDTRENAVKENIPYYKSVTEYQARTAHTPGKPQKEGDQIVTRCTVCGDIVKNEPDNTPNVGVSTVTAASVDFDTVNVSWTKVDGATAYRLYYRSSDEGINKWQRIRTFTGDTTSYPVNGLTTGSKYRFTVRAEVTQDGKTTLGDYSKKGAVAVPKLTAPEIKSVTASGKTTKVTWSRVDGASGYIVFRNSQRVGTVTKGSKVTWTDKKPVSGAKYQVRAYRTEAKKNFKSNLSEPK